MNIITHNDCEVTGKQKCPPWVPATAITNVTASQGIKCIEVLHLTIYCWLTIKTS